MSFTKDFIEELVGFSDPGLQDILDMPTYIFGLPPHYFFYLSCTPYNDTYYVGLLYLISDDWVRVRVFQAKAGQVLTAPSYDFRPTHWAAHFMGISGFADRNFNGLTDLYFGGSDGAKTWHSGIRILELDNNGNLQDITPIGGGIGPNGYDDIDGDGIPELYDAKFFYVPTFQNLTASIQRLDQYWGWNGVEYRVVLVRIEAFFRDLNNDARVQDSSDRIIEYLEALNTAQICDSVAQETDSSYGSVRWYLFHILMYHHAWGDVDAGWDQLQKVVLTAETCADSAGKTVFFEALDEYRNYFFEHPNGEE